MELPRRQSSIGLAWGGHLALDAIVAYVDEELSPSARRRALEHLSRCPECAAEVVAQTQARLALRRSTAPSLPSSLLSALRAIPDQAELPEPPAGLAVSADGQLVSVLREPGEPRRRPRDRRVMLGAGVVVTGLALGGLTAAVGAPGGSLTPAAGTASLGGAHLGANSTEVTGAGRVDGASQSAPSVSRAQPTRDASVGAVPSVAPVRDAGLPDRSSIDSPVTRRPRR
jgi:anti-sigma factor RsiW